MSDDDRWVEGLAGRDATEPEARLLRERILSRPVDPSEAVPERDPARESALIELARREGLLPATSRFWDARRVVATLAVAASLTLAFVILNHPTREPETVRGVEGGIVRIDAPDPAALQRAIVRELADAGVVATAYERLGRCGIDAELPGEITPEIRAVLARHGIPLPADGALTIEIGTGAP